MIEFDFPIAVDIDTAEVGLLGEALFRNHPVPPEPVRLFLREWCREEAPDWVSITELEFKTDPEEQRFVIEKADDTFRWRCDAIITTSYRLTRAKNPDRYDELHQTHGTTRWEYRFPIEIKTGAAKLDYDNQRTVMEYLSAEDRTQPMLIKVDIESVPDSYSIESIQPIRK